MLADLLRELTELYSAVLQAWNSMPPFPGKDFASSPEKFKTALVYAAPTFHVLGYLTYVLFTLTGRIVPNTWSWLMFAYGTSLLTLLEWRMGAPLELLFLPAICAILSIAVFGIRMITASYAEEGNWADFIVGALALVVDIIITVYYLWIGDQLVSGDLSQAQRDEYLFWFLIATNATALTAFSPLIWDMFTGKGQEASLPWILWTLAFGSLTYTTIAEGYLISTLIIYPALNTVLHAVVAYQSVRRQQINHLS